MPEYLYPEAHRNIAMSSVERAFWLDQAALAAEYEVIHGKPPGMSEEQLAGRNKLISVAAMILRAASTREMNEAVANWKVGQSYASS